MAAIPSAAIAQVPAQPPAEPAPSVTAPAAVSPVDGATVVVLLRTTLIALDQANRTGNYSVLRELGSTGFQVSNSTARLSQLFTRHRESNLDLSAVAILEPKLRALPTLSADGLLSITGFFPSDALQIEFDMAYAMEGLRWRLFSLSVDLVQAAGPAAPVEAPLTGEAAPDTAPAPAPEGNGIEPRLPRPEPRSQ